jgi:hypothetical protein
MNNIQASVDAHTNCINTRRPLIRAGHFHGLCGQANEEVELLVVSYYYVATSKGDLRNRKGCG